MAKQTIDIGSAPNDGTGDPLRTAFDITNDNFDEIYGGESATTNPQYVSKNGNDSNDGKSWANAKLTVAAAVDALPTVGTGGNARQEGTVNIGPGHFIETDTPIECNSRIRFIGSVGPESSVGAGKGTSIQLGANQNTDLFSYDVDTFAGWGHGIVFENLRLDGNESNQSGLNSVSGVNMTFANADPDTITRASGDWTTDYVAGDAIKVSGSSNNDGTYIVNSVTATVLTLNAEEELTAEGPVAGVTVTRHPFDIVRIYQGGFNTRIQSVQFSEASRYGLHIVDNAVNCYIYDFTGNGCNHAAIYMNLESSANLCNLGIYGAQIDDCGRWGVIQVDCDSNGGAHNIGIHGLETEGTDSSDHEYVICYRPIGGTGHVNWTINNVSAWRGSSTAPAIIHEATGSGSGGTYVVSHIHGDGYTLSAESDKYSWASVDAHCRSGLFGAFWSRARYEMNGLLLIPGDSSAPENNVTAPTGSIYLRSSGGSGTTLYVKESGTGNTGWVGK